MVDWTNPDSSNGVENEPSFRLPSATSILCVLHHSASVLRLDASTLMSEVSGTVGLLHLNICRWIRAYYHRIDKAMLYLFFIYSVILYTWMHVNACMYAFKLACMHTYIGMSVVHRTGPKYLSKTKNAWMHTCMHKYPSTHKCCLYYQGKVGYLSKRKRKCNTEYLHETWIFVCNFTLVKVKSFPPCLWGVRIFLLILCKVL